MGLILGLDVGIGSLGWGVVDDEQRRIVDLGVRIFESGEEGATKAADRASQKRRAFRSNKRLNRRRKQRKLRLKQFLENEKILSVEDINTAYRTNGFNPDVWKYRAEGLVRKLEPIELASVLINMANHRGYQDFYEDSEEEDSGKLKEAKNRLHEIYETNKSKYRTVGEMIYNEELFKNEANGRVSIRNNAQKNKEGKKETTYRYLIDRKELCKEVKTILSCQREFGYEQLTESVIDECIAIIFKQRDFEDGPGPKKEENPERRKAMEAASKGHQVYTGFDELVGSCPFYPEEKRGHKNSQLYDMYVLVNSLSQLQFIGKDGEEVTCPESIVHECRQVLFENRGIITKKILEKICKDAGLELKVPGELSKKKNLVKASYIQLLTDPEVFDETVIARFKEERYDDEKSLSSKIGYVLAKYATPRRRKEELRGSLSEDEFVQLGYADKLKGVKSGGGANVSFKYMREAVVAYLDGTRYGDFQADFIKNHPEEEKQLYLSADGKLLPIKDADMVRNPVVYRTLNETRKIVNALLSKYKDISVINIEIARDVGKSFEQRKETAKYQRQNEEENAQIRDRLAQKLYAEGLSKMPSDKLIERFTLWEQQKGQCVYSGTAITFADLFYGTKVQVDHIIPQSIVLDETLNNKVLVLTEENQKKKNQLPLQYMDEKQAADFKNRVNNFFRTGAISRIKKEYLLLPFLDDETISGFVDRNINDTRTISKYISNYLSHAFKGTISVNVIKGSVTSRFRKRWLGSKTKRYDYVPSIYGLEKKTRNLHYYHHAIDAIVVANLTRPYIEIAQDYVKLQSIWKEYSFHSKQGNAETAQRLFDDYNSERAKAADKMHEHYHFNREFTLGLLDSGYVPSICEDLRNEIEVRVPLCIDFKAHEYVEMETAFYELRKLLNSVRCNFKETDIEGMSDVVDPDTLEEINVRLPIVCPEIACLKSNGQIVHVNKPIKEDVEAATIKKELDTFVKKLEPRDVADYIEEIRMLSEEEYSGKVHEYYGDDAFSRNIELPYVSFKITRKFRGGMVASDNPVPLAKTGFSTFKELEEDMKSNLKSPYYVRFNKGIDEITNFSIYDARSYYCMEIYLDGNNDYQIRGIRYVDVRSDNKHGKMVLLKPLPEGCTHYIYLFKNEYIKAYKKGKLKNNGFGAYRGVENINQNTGKMRLYANNNLNGRDTYINLAGETVKIEMSILGHIIGEQKCGDQSLFITENDLT